MRRSDGGLANLAITCFPLPRVLPSLQWKLTIGRCGYFPFGEPARPLPLLESGQPSSHKTDVAESNWLQGRSEPFLDQITKLQHCLGFNWFPLTGQMDLVFGATLARRLSGYFRLMQKKSETSREQLGRFPGEEESNCSATCVPNLEVTKTTLAPGPFPFAMGRMSFQCACPMR